MDSEQDHRPALTVYVLGWNLIISDSVLKLQLWKMWFIFYIWKMLFPFSFKNSFKKPTWHSVEEKEKFSLIYEQESCGLLRLQWIWIKLGWIMTFKIKQKDLQFICSCWALNTQLNCSYLKHRVLSKTIGIKTIFRLELCASKILSNCVLWWRMDSNHSCSEDKGLLTAKFNFQHCSK